LPPDLSGGQKIIKRKMLALAKSPIIFSNRGSWVKAHRLPALFILQPEGAEQFMYEVSGMRLPPPPPLLPNLPTAIFHLPTSLLHTPFLLIYNELKTAKSLIEIIYFSFILFQFYACKIETESCTFICG
jgi:hypothetical protein